MKVNDENSRIRGMDPRIRIHTKMSWIRNTDLKIVFWWARYLLAMVFVYFKRAELQHTEYTQHNFWVCLHLAHDAEARCHVIQKM